MGLKLPRVLHVFKLYYPEKYGGVQRAIYEIANHTVDHGFEPTVFALSSQPSQGIFNVGRHKAMTVKQQLYVASTGFSFAALKTFQTLAADADIIHYHFP
ncbi:MAG: glycosyltransferase, partial [Pseudomonadota bacterium]